MYSHKKPFSCKIPSRPALLIGLVMVCIAQQSWADDYFNPALLDIDNPQLG
jgi:outer membrane usher protein